MYAAGATNVPLLLPNTDKKLNFLCYIITYVLFGIGTQNFGFSSLKVTQKKKLEFFVASRGQIIVDFPIR
jgi:hypothetical protein